MSLRYHLNKEAIPAGIFLLLAAASMFLQNVIIPNLTDRVAYGIGGLLVIVAILLFTRSRNAACGVFFIILTVVAVIGIIAWAMTKTIVPLAYLYGARAISFLGLSIVCLRRKHEPKSGPWFTAVAIYVIALPFLFFYGIQEPAISNNLVYYLTVTDLLLFIGLLLTAIAFRNAPETAAYGEYDTASAPQSQSASQTQWTPQYGSVSDSSSKPAEKTPEILRQEEAQNSEAKSTTTPISSMDRPNTERASSDETAQVETAQVEWLDD